MRTVIALRDVNLQYDGKAALKSVHWTVHEGEAWALIGPNGAGKTSLISMINGYRWPSTGSVEVLGQKFGETDLREMRRGIGLISSYLEQWLSDESRVLDTVVSGRRGSTKMWEPPSNQEIRAATARLRALDSVALVSKRLGELSQGEKQKVMIARALMAEARLLILDEPCEGLDLRSRESLLRGLTSLAEKMSITMIYVTHRTDEIPRGFRYALLLKNGSVLAKGRIEKTLTSRKISSCFGVNVRLKRLGERYYTFVVE